jgi:hypothetical protein
MGFCASRAAAFCLRYHGIDVSTAGFVDSIDCAVSVEASVTGVLASVAVGRLGSVRSASLVGDFVPLSRNANSESSAIGSFLSFASEARVLKAHLDGLLGVAFASRGARCIRALYADLDGRAAAFWHALHTYLVDIALAKDILIDLG